MELNAATIRIQVKIDATRIHELPGSGLQSIGSAYMAHHMRAYCEHAGCPSLVVWYATMETAGGRTFSFDLAPTDTLEESKTQFQDRMGVPPDQMMFYLHNRKLEANRPIDALFVQDDGESFGLQHLKEGEVLLLVKRFRGC